VEAPQDNQSPPSLENFQPAKNDNPGFEILEDADEEETEAYTASDHDFVDSTSDFQETSPQTPPAKNMSLAFLADFAFDRMKITYAVQWAAVFMLGVTLSALIANYVFIPLGVLLAALFVWTTQMGMIGGIAFMTNEKIETGKSPHWSRTWTFFLQRFIALILGTIGVSCIVSLAFGLLFGGIFALGMIPYLGPIIGGVMVIPTVVLMLVFIGIMANMYLLPIIIGVENQGAMKSFHALRKLVVAKGFGLYIRSIQAAWASILAAVLVGGVLGLATFGALSINGGAALLGGLSGGISISMVFYLLSVLAVFGVYMAFLSIISTVSFTLVYCDSREGSNTQMNI